MAGRSRSTDCGGTASGAVNLPPGSVACVSRLQRLLAVQKTAAGTVAVTVSRPAPAARLVAYLDKDTGLIDRTYVAMAIAHGLDAVFGDTRDKEFVDSVITGELLLGRMVYCDSFLEAARQGKG